jgi:thiamine phosphate synthase YjbQ (UPF0047 family)
MAERWRSASARKLVQAVRKAGGSVERAGVGRLRVTGPTGSVTIAEPGEEVRRDLRRSAAARLIEERTGLTL